MLIPRIVEYDCYMCDTCRKYFYSEQDGDLEHGIPCKTFVNALPYFWRCPVCGSGKEKLRANTLLDGFAYEHALNDKSTILSDCGVAQTGG